ncbi:MAG: nucleotide pyrophosphatase/phosphodiesterase family protein [Thermoguttaceae bacterium]|jgi:predicted AlkP superfamily pyrophosphatase or phosphodiesterase
MRTQLVLLSIPGLREKDVAVMKNLREMTAAGQIADLVPGFPCLTCPVQANMTTGRPPAEHGVVANGFYWPARREVEMWTSPNECIERPQIWDLLSHARGEITSAVWFPLHSRGCEADYVCTPAPIHNPDGSESLWCYTRPIELYGTLREELGDFPLRHFWGPLANIRSTAWIAASAVAAAKQFRPDFFYIYLPHLDYAAQRSGPDSPAADAAVAELDDLLGRLAEAFAALYGKELLWLVAGEYAITPVDHVAYPNRVLRQAGLLSVREEADGEHLDLAASRAWALADHQLAHVFVADGDEQLAARVAALFRDQPGIAEVLVGPQRGRYALEHPRSGDVILISAPRSWQAYYWWRADDRAPAFARAVDIHRKPGYDPLELHFDPAAKSIPLDCGLVRGSHGAPAVDRAQRTVLLASRPILPTAATLADTDVFGIVLEQFGLKP